MNEIQEIEKTCREYQDKRGQLRRRHELRQKAIRAVDAEHNAELRRLQDECSALNTTLETQIESARAEFLKPKAAKTREFHGITVGFKKSSDTLIMPDEAILVERIEKQLVAKQAETVLNRTVTIIKAAFKKLDKGILQQLGCSILTGSDKVVIHTNDDDIETLVQKSIGEAPKTESEGKL